MPCSCSEATWTVRCTDCFQYRATCARCFIELHIHNPFHWAEEWTGKYFVRKDISELGHVITLNHDGGPCPEATSRPEGQRFTVVHSNGIHVTRLQFCNCLGADDRVQQLMQARLFPPTTTQPMSAFSFGMLREFHIHSLASKKSAFDHMGGLRRLTNNATSWKVPVSARL